MPKTVSREKIQEAFRILFGPQITFSDAVLNYIQPSGIKSAFREQVKRKHPDTASRGDEPSHDTSAEFRTLYEAYRLLMDLKAHRFRRVEKPPAPPQHPSPVAEPGDFFYQGLNLPSHPMRLGEFLFYSRIISWKTLIQAIVYKKQYDDRRLGQYFIDKGLLSEQDLQRYLALQRAHNNKQGNRT